MQSQTFWNEIGSEKTFEDPLYLNKLEPFLHPHSQIVEYGCGYGRLLQVLHERGYQNLLGFDFSHKMIARGEREHPHLNLTHSDSGKIPLENDSVDCIIVSTILCCIPDRNEQQKLIEEIMRVLKKGGVLYLSDFLLCDHPRYVEKYQQGQQEFGDWGIYTTAEGLTVRHHTTSQIMALLEQFSLQWFEQFDFKTMNNHSARTFHSISQLTIK